VSHWPTYSNEIFETFKSEKYNRVPGDLNLTFFTSFNFLTCKQKTKYEASRELEIIKIFFSAQQNKKERA